MTRNGTTQRRSPRLVLSTVLISAKTSLTIGYESILKASLEVTEDDLRNLRNDDGLKERLYESPLRDLMLGLVDMLEADSEESQSLEREKNSLSQIVYEATSTSLSDSPSLSTTLPSTPQTSKPHFPPSSYQTPDKKRKVSDTSFEIHSTETTPNKLVQPEAKVQALQNTFVKNIINELWMGEIKVPWVKGRHVFLSYTEFSLV